MELQLPEDKLQALLQIFSTLEDLYKLLLKYPNNLIPKKTWTGVTMSSFTTRNFILPIDADTVYKLNSVFGLDLLVMAKLNNGELYLPNLEDIERLQKGDQQEAIVATNEYRNVNLELGYNYDAKSTLARVEQVSTLHDPKYVMVPSIDIDPANKRIQFTLYIYVLDTDGRPLLVDDNTFRNNPAYKPFAPITMFLTFNITDPIYLEDKPIIEEDVVFKGSPNTFSYNVRALKLSELTSLPEDPKLKLLIEILEGLMSQINATIEIDKD